MKRWARNLIGSALLIYFIWSYVGNANCSALQDINWWARTIGTLAGLATLVWCIWSYVHDRREEADRRPPDPDRVLWKPPRK